MRREIDWDDSYLLGDADKDLEDAIRIFCENEIEICDYLRDGKIRQLTSLIDLEKLKIEYPNGDPRGGYSSTDYDDEYEYYRDEYDDWDGH